MRAPVVVGLGVAALWPGLAAAERLAAPELPPAPIFNGIEAGQCDFPSAVAMLDRDTGQLFCTGTLIHPSVVVFAAHCMDPETSWATPGSVMFGEDVDHPVREVPVVACASHPQWDSAATVFDLAACVLAQPVTGVPTTPLILGCEVDLLQPGTDVVIVGFGATNAELDPEGEPIAFGAGRKRFTTQTITSVSPVDNEIIMIGPDKGGCFGDSGGPAFARMVDGTWRVIGAASTLHPETIPDENGEICGLGTVYEVFWPNMDWLEGFAGLDLSPCFDVGGAWSPTAACGGFPADLLDPQSTWGSGCATKELGGWSATCGQPFGHGPFPGPEPEPEPPPPEPEPEPEPEPPPEPPPTPPPPAPPVPGPEETSSGESESDDSGAGVADDGLADRGCTCSQGQDGWRDRSWWLAALVLLARRRRR